MTDRAYIAIDLKSFYASVECMDRQQTAGREAQGNPQKNPSGATATGKK